MGTTIGTQEEPMFANILMTKIEPLILATSNKFNIFFKLFIDYIFLLWTGTYRIHKRINSIHPTIKFSTQSQSESKIKIIRGHKEINKV
jgi:hypothetical protein